MILNIIYNGVLMKNLMLASTIAIFALSNSAHAHGEKPHARKFSEQQLSENHAFGKSGDSNKVTRTVAIDMSDRMRFSPDSLTLREGETVKFLVKNSGKLMHEFVLGTMKELGKHAEMMKKFPGMEHDEPFMAHVAPGKTETIVWQFSKPGEFHFGCLLPGHFEAGMVGKINVTRR